MSKKKPPLTHSNFARKLAASGASLAKKKAQLSQSHAEVTRPDVSVDPIEWKKRIGPTDRLHDRPTFEGNIESRQANLEKAQEARRDAAELQAQKNAERQRFGSRLGYRGEQTSPAPSTRGQTAKVAPSYGPRAAGREKVQGYYGKLGIFRPAYSSRIDSEKRPNGYGIHRTKVSLPRPGG